MLMTILMNRLTIKSIQKYNSLSSKDSTRLPDLEGVLHAKIAAPRYPEVPLQFLQIIQNIVGILLMDHRIDIPINLNCLCAKVRPVERPSDKTLLDVRCMDIELQVGLQRFRETANEQFQLRLVRALRKI